MAMAVVNIPGQCCFTLKSPILKRMRWRSRSISVPLRRIPVSQAQSVNATTSSSSSSSSSSSRSQGILHSIVAAPLELTKRGAALPVNLAAAAGAVATVCLLLLIRAVARRSSRSGGSVSDLIRRGQLRSDRNTKPDSRPLKYDDPFNNPLVKSGAKNPIVRMCGKIFRLAPVTLTEEKVVSHQNRRIQAYQWRRPVVFLNEGDPVPEGVDPDEVRWIPSNHPFATTQDYIDEDLAQKNVYQTRGVPSRVRAEHEALRRKMNDSMREAEEKSRQEEPLPPPGDLDSSGKTIAAEHESSVWPQSEVQ